jgi:hypothetical protein
VCKYVHAYVQLFVKKREKKRKKGFFVREDDVDVVAACRCADNVYIHACVHACIHTYRHSHAHKLQHNMYKRDACTCSCVFPVLADDIEAAAARQYDDIDINICIHTYIHTHTRTSTFTCTQASKQYVQNKNMCKCDACTCSCKGFSVLADDVEAAAARQYADIVYIHT